MYHKYTSVNYPNDKYNEWVYYDINGGSSCILSVIHEHKQIWVKMNKIPHIGEGDGDYKEDILKEFTKCNYEIRYR